MPRALGMPAIQGSETRSERTDERPFKAQDSGASNRLRADTACLKHSKGKCHDIPLTRRNMEGDIRLTGFEC